MSHPQYSLTDQDEHISQINGAKLGDLSYAVCCYVTELTTFHNAIEFLQLLYFAYEYREVGWVTDSSCHVPLLLSIQGMITDPSLCSIMDFSYNVPPGSTHYGNLG